MGEKLVITPTKAAVTTAQPDSGSYSPSLAIAGFSSRKGITVFMILRLFRAVLTLVRCGDERRNHLLVFTTESAIHKKHGFGQAHHVGQQ